MKVIICGGHLTPALALIEELQSKKDCQIIFFGRKFSTEGNRNPSAEYQTITKKGIKFVTITTGRLQRKFTKYTIPSLLKIPIGFLQAFMNILIIRPSIVVAFGGYLSTPVVFSAWLLGIDSLIHEQASVPGLANRINSLFAGKIFLAWHETKRYFGQEKTEVTGNLVRSSIFNKNAKDPNIAKFLKKSKNLIFVTGGNQGSHFLNSLVFDLLPNLGNFSILHQVGMTNYDGDLDRSKKIKKTNYLAVDYLDGSDIGAAFAAAEIVIARAGANTVWELGVLSKVAILVPLPIAAAGEQTQNAKILELTGSAIIIEQQNATSKKILQAIENINQNFEVFAKRAQDFQKTLPQDGSDKIADFIISKEIT